MSDRARIVSRGVGSEFGAGYVGSASPEPKGVNRD